MPKILLDKLPIDVVQAILHPDPLEGEDICIEDGEGNLLAAIIPAKAYQFFLKKIGEMEDEIDTNIAEEYDPNATSLDQLMKETGHE